MPVAKASESPVTKADVAQGAVAKTAAVPQSVSAPKAEVAQPADELGRPRPYSQTGWTPQAHDELTAPKILGARKASATLALTALLIVTPTVYPLLTRGLANAAVCPPWIYLLWLVALLDLAYSLLLAQVDHRWSRLAAAGFMALQAGCAAALLGVLLLARGDHPLLGGLQLSAPAMRGAAIAVCMVSVGLHGLVGCLCGYLEEPAGGVRRAATRVV